MDWLEQLRLLPPERRIVLHEPETERYSRARRKLAYVVRASYCLGARADDERTSAVLLATWAPSESGRGPGYYCCFRLFLDEQGVSVAVLYAFYDGSERSPGFRSLEAASAFAESRGFTRQAMMKITTIRDYPFVAAGQTWNIPQLELVELPDGSRGLSQAEISRVHAAIANEICGSAGPLTIDELDFLCDVTDTPLAEVARSLDLHRSTLSKWRSAGEIAKTLYSVHLKKMFWFRLFGEQLRGESISFDHLRDEQDFLRYAHERAIHERLADPVEPVAA